MTARARSACTRAVANTLTLTLILTLALTLILILITLTRTLSFTRTLTRTRAVAKWSLAGQISNAGVGTYTVENGVLCVQRHQAFLPPV